MKKKVTTRRDIFCRYNMNLQTVSPRKTDKCNKKKTVEIQWTTIVLIFRKKTIKISSCCMMSESCKTTKEKVTTRRDWVCRFGMDYFLTIKRTHVAWQGDTKCGDAINQFSYSILNQFKPRQHFLVYWWTNKYNNIAQLLNKATETNASVLD